jgi:hypothetical protein
MFEGYNMSDQPILRGGLTAYDGEATGLRVLLKFDDEWPSDAQMSTLAASGVVGFLVIGQMDIGVAPAAQAVRFIRFLRDARSRRLSVRWRGRVPLALCRSLSHLPAPTSIALSAAGDRKVEFSWRLGPDFLAIRDTRSVDDMARYIVEGEQMIAAFEWAHMSRRADLAPTNLHESLVALEEAGLILRLGDWLTVLPCRWRGPSVD